ncbi:MAG TPA: hypothetical protein VH677_03115 [Nitrososphaera sp.]
MSTEGDSGMPPAAMDAGNAEPQVIEVEQAVPLPERSATNVEAMIAGTLSRMKKNAKILEKNNKTLGQILDALKKAEKERAGHSRQVEAQNKKLLAQIAQMQKRLSKSAAPKKKAAKKKSKAKRR